METPTSAQANAHPATTASRSVAGERACSQPRPPLRSPASRITALRPCGQLPGRAGPKEAA